jgi:tetratricopeptide (TPR) repeat protein
MATFKHLLPALLLLLGAGAASAQIPRLLVTSAVTERDDHLDLAIDFGCTLRYVTHTPASQGDVLRVTLRIGADCELTSAAQFPVERMMPVDARGLVRSIELQPGLTDGAELTINWNRIEKYVIAPASGMRGLRIRVMRTPQKSVLVNEPGSPDTYSINLVSSRDPIPDGDVAQAAASLQVPVYVSQATVDDVAWYRLRAGPFPSRREADKQLRAAQARYPTAWLAIDDEKEEADQKDDDELVTLPKGPAVARAPETRADPALDKVLADARAAMSHKRLDEAIALLTKVTAAQDYQHRVDAAELLGLARERKGQLAQAKSAYEDYLLRYPDSTAAPRIKQRLQALRTASLPGRHGGGAGESDTGWTFIGNASEIYRRDDTQLRTDALSRSLVAQNALLTDIDGVARRHGEESDLTARVSFGYFKDLLTEGPGDQLRVSSAYVDYNDHELGLGARLGRQSRGMAGVPGTFDGLLASWQWHPQIGFGFATGMPTESTREAPDTQRYFFGLGTNLATADRSWDATFYALAQQYHGEVDRRSVGVEAHYVHPGRTLVLLADYDVHYTDLNSATLVGTLVTDSQWTFNVDASRQRSPMLSIRNALIGQPTLAFEDLLQQFSVTQLEQLAQDRSAQLTQAGLSASRPLGDRTQWTISLLSLNISGTPASGGVEAVPPTGRDDSITSDLQISSLFMPGDLQSLGLRYERNDIGTQMSFGLGSRFPIGSALRLTTRLRVDRRTMVSDDSQQWLLLPSLRMDYMRGRNTVEFESGAELGSHTGANSSDHSTRLYFSLGYRISLDPRVR